MTPQDVRRRVSHVRETAYPGNYDRALELETALFVAVLAAIRGGAAHPRLLAAEALRSLEIDFPRTETEA